MKKIGYMIRKEFRQIFRDPPMIAIIFFVPIVQLLVFSFAVTTEVKHVELVVVDLDDSAVSREIRRDFASTDWFRTRLVTRDLSEIEEYMRGWDAQLGIVFPAGFGGEVERGLTPQIGIVIDGVDGNAASVAMGYATGILSRASQEPPLVLEERMLYNPDLDSKNHMVPAIIVVLLTIIPMMLSAMSLVKEKEIGTLEQLLVTPLTKRQLLMGKLTPFLILSYAELAIVTIVAVLVFRIEMNGSYLDLAFAALLYLGTTIGLGIFISTFSGTQQQAMFFAWFIMMFMILLGGFMIPVANMPLAVQRITYLDPMRYFIFVVRDIFQKGSGLSILWRDVAALAAYGVLIFSFGVFKFRKRVS